MYFFHRDQPQARQHRSPEHRRVFEQHTRNIRRLIDYQNKRLHLGLPMVSYPEQLLVIPESYAWPITPRS